MRKSARTHNADQANTYIFGPPDPKMNILHHVCLEQKQKWGKKTTNQQQRINIALFIVHMTKFTFVASNQRKYGAIDGINRNDWKFFK